MKKLLFLFLLLSFSFQLKAQKAKTSQDSINVFYDQLFTLFQKQYLYKKTVDWKTVKAETNENLKKYTDFKSSLSEIKNLFTTLNATHCAVHYQDKIYNIPFKLEPNSTSEQWQKKFAGEHDFEVKILDGKYGYILIPAINYSDFSSENTHKIAQALYDQIAALKMTNHLEGWILDLRINSGGNSEPMLLALYDFLGDHDVYGLLDVNKNPIFNYRLDKGTYVFQMGKKSFKQAYITPKGDLMENAKVAVITGVITASSGEITALAFKGRPNSIFIGENTAGFTTGNSNFDLAFETRLFLTTSYDADRNNIYYKQIIPDIPISKEDNFDDLLADKNIQEAIKFIKG